MIIQSNLKPRIIAYGGHLWVLNPVMHFTADFHHTGQDSENIVMYEVWMDGKRTGAEYDLRILFEDIRTAEPPSKELDQVAGTFIKNISNLAKLHHHAIKHTS